MWLVVGLGNPGPTYASHRHNVGFLVADELARRVGVRFAAPKGMRAEVAEGRLGPPGPDSTRLVVVKPRTFMNESGAAVVKVSQFYKLLPEQVVVIHDELDLDPGQLRLKLGGGDNGHNGLRSIRQTLGTGDFYRVRVGIGRPPGRQDPASYVLTPFPASQRTEVELEVGRAADAVESLVADGLDRTQSRFNS